MDREDEVRRGQEAAELLRNPMLKGAFDGVESQLVAQMRASGFKDSETHHRLVIALQMLAAIKRSIEQTVENGQIAKLELEQRGKLSRLFG